MTATITPARALITSTSFASTLKNHGHDLRRSTVTTLQVNIGKRCNQACHHCHVESGPEHPDNMQAATIDRLLELLAAAPEITTVDITGGAPELNPHFRRFVSAIRSMGKTVINRCNLTVLFEPGQEGTAQFLADNQVNIVASLPCYSEANVNAQRGKHVFSSSIQALQLLNSLGYGKQHSKSHNEGATKAGLKLDLVYNPLGAFLPPAQNLLQQDYKRKLYNDFDIQFNALYTITNMPIKRFAHQLQRDGLWQDYMQLLLDNFNNDAVDSLMCKTQLSVGFDGQIYDCDFNQMLDLPIATERLSIFDITALKHLPSMIAVADHCYACTAGAGSSCGGSLV